MLDPIDGLPGIIAWLIGGLFHYPIVWILYLTGANNISNAGYNVLRIMFGWGIIFALITLPLWWFIGAWSLFVVFCLFIVMLILANIY